jgi:hypothetical protein
MKPGTFVILLLLCVLPTAVAQSAESDISGTWRADTPDGPTEVVVRPDSSASMGDEIVRWRIVGDSLHLAIGEEWMVYGFKLSGNRLTLSGGDLEDPVELERVGPPSPRPEGVEVPPAPPADRRANP